MHVKLYHNSIQKEKFINYPTVGFKVELIFYKEDSWLSYKHLGIMHVATCSYLTFALVDD